MLMFPLQKKMSRLSSAFIFLPPVFPPLGISLFLTLLLSGNDVNRVKCFRGPRGRKMRNEFEEQLTSTEKCGEGNNLAFFIFPQHLFLSVIHVRTTHKESGTLLYSLSSMHFYGVQHPGGSCRFLFLLPPSHPHPTHTPSLFSSPLTMPSFSLLIATRLSGNLHKTSDLWFESEPPLGRWDIDWVHFLMSN